MNASSNIGMDVLVCSVHLSKQRRLIDFVVGIDSYIEGGDSDMNAVDPMEL